MSYFDELDHPDMDDDDERRARRAEDDLSDRLFREDMEADREKHTFRDGDDFFMVWLMLFDADPVNVRANFFEEEPDGTWKCQVIDDLKHYAQCRGFQNLGAIRYYLEQSGVPIGADE